MEQLSPIDIWLEAAAEQFGTPAYVYDLGAIERRGQRIRQAFSGRFSISFAVKSNPNPALIHWLGSQVDYLDVSSIGELRAAINAGWPSSRLSFTGPGKRRWEIQEALERGLGELVVESLQEAETANELALVLKRRQRILIRLSPSEIPKGFGDHMAGRPSPFGIDVEDADHAIAAVLPMPGLHLCGFHIYAGTQCLKEDAVCQNYRNFLAIFQRTCNTHQIRPEKLVFGSGLGIPYTSSDAPIDLEKIGLNILPDLDSFLSGNLFKETELVLEMGRYLVGEAGFFLTRVVLIKESRGARFAICDGGMNHHLAATGHFGMVMHRNYPMHKVGGKGHPEPVNLVGPLCTSIDRLANNIELPRVEVGDLIAVHSSGAYGPTASPLHFISHPVAREIVVDADGLRDVTWMGQTSASAG